MENCHLLGATWFAHQIQITNVEEVLLTVYMIYLLLQNQKNALIMNQRIAPKKEESSMLIHASKPVMMNLNNTFVLLVAELNSGPMTSMNMVTV